MNLENINWNKNTYQDYLKFLESLSDEKYREFHKNLTNTKYEILGINLPALRKIAKTISKGDIEEFLQNTGVTFYEEVMVKGLVIASIKDKELLLKYLDDFVNMIDNWAICDSFCNSLKIVLKDKEYWFNYFKNYLNSNNEFKVRVGLIVFLDFYIEEEYLNKIFNLVDYIKLDKYYVNMGIAWLLCECFIKYQDKTLDFLRKTRINTFTFNKTISKIRDSYRVSKEMKDYLLSLKRKD